MLTNIKKNNAILSLFTCLMLLIHVVYQAVAYLMLFYYPIVSKILGYAVLIPAVLHGVMSAISVLFLHDSRKIMYKKANVRTYIQRICAVIIVVLLPAHLYSYDIHDITAGSALFYAAVSIQIIFYGAIMTHVAVSVTKALITLGMLENVDKMHIIDRILFAVCAALFVAVSIIVTGAKMTLFGM